MTRIAKLALRLIGKAPRDPLTVQASANLGAGQVSRRCYVFYTKRKQDREAWPNVYENQTLAWNAPFRVSTVVPVEIPIGPLCLKCSSPDHVMGDCPHRKDG